MKRLLPAALFATLMLASTPLAAQDFFRFLFGPPRGAPIEPPRTAPAVTKPAPPKEVDEVPPPYEGEMSRIAEILGALHYLRPLCGSAEKERWRDEMQALITAEQPPAPRRDRMIASFNRSYNAYEQTYRTCTPSADLAIKRFIDEGAKLSREIATKYGN
jgi:uncharacterized protein (TIGR02301 family)